MSVAYTLPNQIDRHAHENPDGRALLFRDEVSTWLQLRDRSHRVGALLRSLGVGAGDRVAIALTNRPEYVDLVIGINRIGAVAVPVNFRLTDFEMAYVLRDSGAAVVVTEAAMGLDDTARAAIGQLDAPVHQLVLDGRATAPQLDYDSLVAAASPAAIEWSGSIHDVALILYTSGTTGRPKGAIVTHEGFASQSLNTVTSLGLIHEDDVMLGASPMFHIAGVGFTMPALQFGVTLCLLPTGALDSESLLDVLESSGTTMLGAVPTVWQELCLSPTIARRDLRLRSVMWGAAPAIPALLRLINETFPGASVSSSFGMTETLSSLILTGEHAIEKLGSVGKPLPTFQIRIVDPDMNDVGVGEVGEIVYRGPSVTAGYWNNPAATEEAFRGGWFHSGDLVRRDEDGFVFVVDRLKDMIISGGENIYCAEVEAAIGELAAVRDVAIVGKHDERWGEVPVAFVSAVDPADPPAIEDILAICAERLAPYKRPKDIRFVAEFVRTPTGKIQKGPLRDEVNSTAHP
jgi:fatty-acyl-CoA synthase